MKKQKLELKKKVIASLSDAEKRNVIGGEDAYTTSNSDCTHFLCCADDCDVKITIPQTECAPCPPNTNECSVCNVDCPSTN